MSIENRMKSLLGEADDGYKQANKFVTMLRELGRMTPAVKEMLDRAEKGAAKGSQSSSADLPFLRDLHALLVKHKGSLFLNP